MQTIFLHFGKAPGPFLTIRAVAKKVPTKKRTSKTGRLHTDLVAVFYGDRRRIYSGHGGYFIFWQGECVKVQFE